MADSTFEFDVFLSHNSRDKDAVEQIARNLQKQYGLKPWFDKWHLVAGDAWQPAIDEALDKCQTFAVFVGPSGIGAWENPEMQVAQDLRTKDRTRRVIPVLLPGAPDNTKLKLPAFLGIVTWVDFRKGLDDISALDMLQRGIKGIPLGDGGIQSASSVQVQSGPLPSARLYQNEGDTSQPQKKGRIPRPRREANSNTNNVDENLTISRNQVEELNELQHKLNDQITGYIMFNELTKYCDLAFSLLEEGQRKESRADITAPAYWSDIKDQLINAKVKIDGEIPGLIKSTNDFSRFTDRLNNALRLVETVSAQMSKPKKSSVIDQTLVPLQYAVLTAKSVETKCRNDATGTLKEIERLIKSIFGQGQSTGSAIEHAQKTDVADKRNVLPDNSQTAQKPQARRARPSAQSLR